MESVNRRKEEGRWFGTVVTATRAGAEMGGLGNQDGRLAARGSPNDRDSRHSAGQRRKGRDDQRAERRHLARRSGRIDRPVGERRPVKRHSVV